MYEILQQKPAARASNKEEDEKEARKSLDEEN